MTLRLMEEVTMKGLLPLESAMLSFYCLYFCWLAASLQLVASQRL